MQYCRSSGRWHHIAVEEPSMAAAAARRRGGGRGDGGEKALGTALTKDVYELGAQPAIADARARGECKRS